MSSFLADDLGTYDDSKWRFFRYESGAYHEFPDARASTALPGEAYWLIVRGGATVDVGATTSLSTASSFELTLESGWNDIAVPFGFPVAWADVTAGGSVDGPYSYNGTWHPPSEITELEPWQGYAVKNNESNPITLTIPPRAATTVRGGSSESSGAGVREHFARGPEDGASFDWSIRIAARAGDARDEFNEAGSSESAQEERDPYDYPEPPPVGQYVSLSFPHPEWSVLPGDYTTDVRPAKPRGDVWRIRVESNLPGVPIELSWEDTALPAGLDAVLLDLRFDAPIELRSQRTYELHGTAPFDLELWIGTTTELATALPDNRTSLAAAPSPFSGSTVVSFEVARAEHASISIYDVKGRLVKTLVDELRPRGRHSVSWSGESDRGGRVAAGVYFLRLSAGAPSAARRIVMLR